MTVTERRVTCPDCANLIVDGIWTSVRPAPTIPDDIKLSPDLPAPGLGPCFYCGAGPDRPRYGGEFYLSREAIQ